MNTFLLIALYVLAALSLAAMAAIVYWDRLAKAGGWLRRRASGGPGTNECGAYEGDGDGR